MLLNDVKGSHGMFSRAGKHSTEKFHILMKKEEILEGKVKSLKIRDHLSEDKKQFIAGDEDDLDLFALEDKIKNGEILDEIQEEQRKKIFKNHKKEKSLTEDGLKRIIIVKIDHSKRRSVIPIPKFDNPPCTRYNPKYDFVWKKSVLVGAKWNTKRNFQPKNTQDKSPDFFTQDYKISGKNFIDMNKMKDRDGFIDEKNLSRESLHNSFNSVKSSTEKNKTKRVSSKMRLKGPDFKKTISRERLERVKGERKNIIPFSIPKYQSVRSSKYFITKGPVVLVKYDKMLDRRDDLRNRTFERFTNYDVDKVLNKINNYKKPVTPDFNRMISRPNNEGHLPLYMKKNYTRQGAESCSETTLKMNNYADSRFVNTTTCFFPKKSFNKIVNLNLLTSKKFKENLGYNENEEEFGNDEVNNNVKKAMNFYNKNFDDLLKESTLNKFDNVTFKTIKKYIILKEETIKLRKVKLRNF